MTPGNNEKLSTVQMFLDISLRFLLTKTIAYIVITEKLLDRR